MKVQNGDTIVFNTDPPQHAVVVGTPGYPEPLTTYGLIFGTAGAPDARAMTQEQLDQALADGLIQVVPKPGRKREEPKKLKPKPAKKAKAKKKAAKKTGTIVPPWGKK